jgi:hypothetical protein
MTEKKKETPGKGTWGVRLLIRVFTVILGLLVFWLLGFLVRDIESLKGPDYLKVERKYVDPALTANTKVVQRQIDELTRMVAGKQSRSVWWAITPRTSATPSISSWNCSG